MPDAAGIDLANIRHCLELEREEERLEHLHTSASVDPRELERRGVGLHNLRIESVESGLYGRTLLTLKPTGARPLPPTRLSPGVAVGLRPAGGSATDAVRATLTRVGGASVVVSIEELPEGGLREPLLLLLMHNEVTYRRIEAALGAITDGTVSSAASPIVRALLGGENGRPADVLLPPPPPPPLPLELCRNRGLNEGQRAAVAAGLAAAPVCLIHGPPGA
jgi:ATP-dependent RNA/DNA helicase IGHMBP2